MSRSTASRNTQRAVASYSPLLFGSALAACLALAAVATATAGVPTGRSTTPPGNNTSNAASAAANRLLQNRGNAAQGSAAAKAYAAQQQAMLRQYDLNRDGQLSNTEMLYARKRFFGSGGGGNNGMMNGGQAPQPVLQPAGDPADMVEPAKKPAKVAKKRPASKSLVERFDKDGDGKLNAEEKAAAREAIAKRQK